MQSQKRRDLKKKFIKKWRNRKKEIKARKIVLIKNKRTKWNPFWKTRKSKIWILRVNKLINWIPEWKNVENKRKRRKKIVIDQIIKK